MTIKIKTKKPLEIKWMESELTRLTESYDLKIGRNISIIPFQDQNEILVILAGEVPSGLNSMQTYVEDSLRNFVTEKGWEITEEKRLDTGDKSKKLKLSPEDKSNLEGHKYILRPVSNVSKNNYTQEQIRGERILTELHSTIIRSGGNNLENSCIDETGSFTLSFRGNYDLSLVERVKTYLAQKGYSLEEKTSRPSRDLFGRFRKKGNIQEYEARSVSGEKEK